MLLAAMIGLAFVIPAQTQPVHYGATTPSLFPSIGAALVGIGGLWLILLPDRTRTVDLRPLARNAGVAALASLGFAGIQWIGYLWTAPVLTIVLTLMVGQRRPLWLSLGGVAAPVALWALFALVLQRPLP